MKGLKRILAVTLSVLLMLSCVFSVSAASSKIEWSPTVTVDNVTATAGDTVLVNINISNNTYGIMAVTISVMYDESVLEYVDYYKGIFKQYYVVKKSGYIAIVDCENKNVRDDGVFITLEFKVKENVYGGTYPIKIGHVRPNEKGENLKDCFANWRGDTITPVVTNGSVTVPLTQENCRHRFGEWVQKAEPSCASEGVEMRNCSACGKSETRALNKTEHIYDENWTIDTAANKDAEGVMSRHCKGCSKKTDYVYYPYSIVTEKGFKNTVGDSVTPDERQQLVGYEDIVDPPASNDEPTVEDTPPAQEIPDTQGDSQAEATDIPDDASTLLSDKREGPEQNGIFGRVFFYLFGYDGESGIINAIINAFKQFLKNLF